MSKFTRTMVKAIDEVGNFLSTSEGTAVMGGVNNAINLGLSALVVKKLFPAKATFGNGIMAGLGCVALATIIGCAAVQQAKFETALEKDREIDSLRTRMNLMKNRIDQLNAKVKAAPHDDTAVLAVYRVRMDDLKNQLAELQAGNEELSKRLAAAQQIVQKDIPEPTDEASMW